MATIPITGGAKAPPAAGAGWMDLSPFEQWRALGPNWKGNIALLCGGGAFVIDCDSPDTEAQAKRWLEGLGLQHTAQVRTVHGGLHIWLRCPDLPPDLTVRRLAFGPGELRARRCYTMAPPSLVEGRRYRFEAGTAPERVATLKWQDLAQLVKPQAQGQPIERPPVPLLKREIPLKALSLLRLLQNPQPALEAGKTRSEAEAQIVAHLIVAGWDFEAIRGAFEEYRPGHYREHKNPGAYIVATYHNILNWLASQGDRPALAELYQEASAWQWPGRTGLHDRAVYLALLSLAWQHGTAMPYASLRDIGLLAGKDPQAVANALARLRKAGLIQRLGETAGTGCWCVKDGHKSHIPELKEVPLTGGALGTMGRLGAARGVNSDTPGPADSEMWATLGRSCEVIYRALGDTPKGAGELATLTGRSRRTVERALTKLGAHNLAQKDTGGWVRGTATLGEVTQAVGAENRLRVRRLAVELQRETYRRWREERKGQNIFAQR